MKNHRINSLRRRLRFANGFNVEPIGKAGGLSLWWDEFMEVQIVFSSKHVIDAIARVEDEHRWVRVTGVYGTPYRGEKSSFWDWMYSHFSPSDIPWLCGGDFNEFLWDHEKSGGGGVEGTYKRPRFLADFLNMTELLDLDFQGLWDASCSGLWRFGQRRRNVKRLWRSVGLGNGSDRCRCNGFRNLMPVGLTLPGGAGINSNSGDKKLRSLLCNLWSFKSSGELIFRPFKRSKSYLLIFKLRRRAFGTQRSRVKWLREGDLNTQFFHQSTLQRRRRNMILKLKADDGQWVEHPSRVRQIVEDHFHNLFKTGGPRHWGALLDCVPPGITEDMNRDLIVPVSDEEIKAAVMNMGRLKAPGPYGFQGIFYHSFWEDLKTDVHSLIRTLLHEAVGPNTLNATHVVLIPKVPNPEMVLQFRPISLYNYSYKVLSKVLANRLKVVLPNIISSSQNAFVAGRQIHDNIGIAHEMFHFLKGRKAKTKYELGLKIDMQKAYDWVEWDFLDAIMGRMGFCNRWRQLIMGCVSSVQFSILLNAVHDKLLDGVKLGASGPIISYIFFADDTLLFLKVDGKNCRNLVDLINMYCDASGQQVNFQKSSVYFGANIPKRVSAELANILRVKVVLDPGAYLGVLAIPRSKKRGLAYIKEKIMGKVQGWKHKLLSTAGREVLVKAVVQAIPAYPMYIFKFPATVCHDFDTIVVDFWWGSQGAKRKTHWVSKKVLGLPKDMGSLGFRNFSDFNDALLAKQCWRLLSDPTSLWARVVKARYFPNCSFWDATKGGRASWAWTSLLVGREVIWNGSHWQIMGGRDVRVWVDHWLPSLPSGHPEALGEVAVSPNLHVNSLICHESLDWDIDFLLPFISEEAQLAIKSLPFGDFRCKDRLVWDASKNGKYSIKSGFRWLQLGSLASRDHRLPRTRAIPKKLWNLVPIHPIRVLLGLSFAIGYYWEAMGWTGIGAARPSACCVQVPHWIPHPSSFYKINVDASWSLSTHSGFAGVVIRDANGQFMAAERYAFSSPSVAAAEATALLRGCELGSSLGFQ
ncbi:unnamed protein product [Malus baccata var. baccata]